MSFAVINRYAWWSFCSGLTANTVSLICIYYQSFCGFEQNKSFVVLVSLEALLDCFIAGACLYLI